LNKKQSLAFLPRRLGIITSAAGTVIHDFRSSLDESNFGFELFWIPVLVQGAEAKASLVKAIEFFSRTEELDAILIFRGGGSQGDLAVFNDYDVARAVCLAEKPVIAAIGHQEDQSSVQDVSWKALGVPKDIGRFFADIILGFRERIKLSAATVLRLGSAKLEQWAQAVSRSPIGALAGQALMHREVVLRSTLRRVSDGQRRVLETILMRFSSVREQILRGMLHAAERAAIRLDGLEELIRAASPETQLKRGFAFLREARSGKFLPDGRDLKHGTDVLITFRDGERKAKIHDD
jgi:exodeoxyribonuclease VII large subunit